MRAAQADKPDKKHARRQLYTPCTEEKKARFLAALSEDGIVVSACEKTGIPRITMYAARRKDPEFARAWDEAVEVSTQRMEQAAIKRATREKNPSDLLLMFMLKGRRPEVYREKEPAQSGGNSTVNITYVNTWRSPLTELVPIDADCAALPTRGNQE